MAGRPSCAFSAWPDGAPVACGADEVEGEVVDGAHVAGAVALPEAGLVVAEGDVEHPMQAVLDGPVLAHRLGRFGGGEQTP